MLARSLSTGSLLAPLLAMSLAFAAGPAAAVEDDPWPDLRDTLFEDRPIDEASGLIELEAPYRAYDAAIVPISVTAKLPEGDERTVETLTLVIDKNPAPVAAVFHMTPRVGDPSIATRVRVNEYTNVRAIAELSDGSLHMAIKFVKAAGGCSAPALKDQELALQRIGKMKLKQTVAAPAGQPNEAQILISHPNYSGLQMNQVTRHYIPAHYVQTIDVRLDGEPLFNVEGAISLSEDPSIHFHFVPEGPGEITVRAEDTEGDVFEQSWPVAPGASS